MPSNNGYTITEDSTGATLSINGTITSTDGKAIDLAGSYDTLKLFSGSDVVGEINGGKTGTLDLIGKPGGTVSDIKNFASLDVKSGTWTIADVENYTNGTTIGPNAKLVLTSGNDLDGGGPIHFDNGASLQIDNTVAPTNVLTGFKVGDSIDITKLADQGVTVTVQNGKVTLVNASGVGETLLIAGAKSGSQFNVVSDGNGGTILEAACYARGTRILTAAGEVEIERLQPGDMVCTFNRPGFSAVRWLGYRQVDCRRHKVPGDVLPVRVSAGAFAENVPVRDLILSPGHQVFTDGVLVPIKQLVNGSTIVQFDAPSVEYWHVELDRHEIVLAEGLPAETYLDQGNRGAFANGGAFMDLHPDFAPRHWAETCVPLVIAGPEVVAAKQRLLKRAEEAFGRRMTAQQDLHLVVDGERLAPSAVQGSQYSFILPKAATHLAFEARGWVPAHMLAESYDDRKLGVCITGIWVDGTPVSLDSPALTEGWHELEQTATGDQRWTRPHASLPPANWTVIVEVKGDYRSWIETDLAQDNEAQTDDARVYAA